MNIIAGIFLSLHGLVHLLYVGQSAKLFELQSGMIWPDGSWLFSRLPGDTGIRILAGILCLVASAGFVAGGVGLFASQSWWRPLVTMSAIFSSIIFLVFWDGRFRALDNQGLLAILINVLVLVSISWLRWPHLVP